MPIEFDLPAGRTNIHNDTRFRALPYDARMRVLSAWVHSWVHHYESL